MEAFQLMFGFLSLCWEVYKAIKKKENVKTKRKEKKLKMRKALRLATKEKDTSELEDLLYDLGFTRNKPRLPNNKGNKLEP